MKETEFDYINVIPLVDVMLVLLTIVLTTSTFIASGAIAIDLPRAHTAKTEALKSVEVNIDSEGCIYINERPVGLEGLRSALSQLDRETPLVIRADRRVALQPFIDVMDSARDLGFVKIRLMTKRD